MNRISLAADADCIGINVAIETAPIATADKSLAFALKRLCFISPPTLVGF